MRNHIKLADIYCRLSDEEKKHKNDYIGCSSDFVLLFLLFQGRTSMKALFPSKNNLTGQ